MRQIAKEHGEKISEYGVEQQDGSVLTFNSEKEFFAHFDLPFIPPTVRAGTHEFDRVDQIADPCYNLLILKQICICIRHGQMAPIRFEKWGKH